VETIQAQLTILALGKETLALAANRAATESVHTSEKKYNSKPFVGIGFGSMPSDLVEKFLYAGVDNYDCVSTGPLSTGWTQPGSPIKNGYTSDVCTSWANTYGVIPFQSNGSLSGVNLTTWYSIKTAGGYIQDLTATTVSSRTTQTNVETRLNSMGLSQTLAGNLTCLKEHLGWFLAFGWNSVGIPTYPNPKRCCQGPVSI
jgi:hypothetical protein